MVGDSWRDTGARTRPFATRHNSVPCRSRLSGRMPSQIELTSAYCLNPCRELARRSQRRTGCKQNDLTGSFLRYVFRRSNLHRPGALAVPVVGV